MGTLREWARARGQGDGAVELVVVVLGGPDLAVFAAGQGDGLIQQSGIGPEAPVDGGGVNDGLEGAAGLPPGLGGPVEGAVAEVLAAHEHPDLAGLQLHGDHRGLHHGGGMSSAVQTLLLRSRLSRRTCTTSPGRSAAMEKPLTALVLLSCKTAHWSPRRRFTAWRFLSYWRHQRRDRQALPGRVLVDNIWFAAPGRRSVPCP